MFIKKYGDVIVGIFYTALAIGLIVMAQLLPKSQVMEIGPDFMPMVVGILTLVLALILLVSSIRKLKNVNDEELEKDESDYKRVAGSLILAIAYVCILKPVGFIISTLLYLALQILVLAPDEKRTKKDIILYIVIDVVFTIVVYFLFRYGFKILLPAGILQL